MPLQNTRYYALVKFWRKILQSDNKKYIKIVYNMLYQDILNKPNTKKNIFVGRYTYGHENIIIKKWDNTSNLKIGSFLFHLHCYLLDLFLHYLTFLKDGCI